MIIGGQDTCQGDSGGPLWVEEDGVGLTIRQMDENFSLDSFYFQQSLLGWSPGEEAVQSRITPVFTQGETSGVHLTIPWDELSFRISTCLMTDRGGGKDFPY